MMMTAAQMAEDMAFGGQRSTKQAYPAQHAGGMRVSQRKRKAKTEVAENPTLPNKNLGEKVTEVDLGLVKMPESSSAIFAKSISKRLRSQTPKLDKGFSNRPNPKTMGPLNQPRPGF